MVNYQVTVLLDRLLSNGLAILGANYTYYYIHTVCVQVAITQIRLYICTGKTFFYCLSIQWVATFHKPVQLFFVLVYIMCCTVIMHIQNWNNSPVTMLKSGPLLGHHCILMSGCSCCCCFCCCCHCVCMQACGRVCEEKSGAWYDT